MKIIRFENITDSVLVKNNCIGPDGVTFLIKDEHDLVFEAARNTRTMRSWFDKIGIKYDSISLIGHRFVYSIGEDQLDLSDLSSGERYLLYLMACKVMNKSIIAQGLFERLGSRLEKVIIDNLADYNDLVIIIYNAIIPNEFKPYLVKEI